MNDKPIRLSVAAVVQRPGDDRFLTVRRPLDDDRLPGVWGLPAVTLRPGELPEAGVRRIGREKLGVVIEAEALIGVDTTDRGEYRLVLIDIAAVLVDGEPDVRSAITSSTRYIDASWTNDVSVLREAAEMGSLCSRILLRGDGGTGAIE